VTAKLIQQAATRLNPGGFLIFEFSPMLAVHLDTLVPQTDLWEKPLIGKDFAGLARIVTLRRT
jgi:methylase of polypeptide subunit release factors